MDEIGCSTLSLCGHYVLATSMEFSLRPYHAYATTMVHSCQVGEDHTTLLTGSVSEKSMREKLMSMLATC